MLNVDLTAFMSALSALSALAACAIATYSAVISYEALKEIKKQRETTYQPEVIITAGEFRVYNKQLNSMHFIHGIGWEYTYENKGTEYIAEGPYITPLPINIYNIGLGAAKMIKISCESDPSEWIHILDDLSKSITGEHPFRAEFQNPQFIYVNMKSASYIDLTIPVLSKEKDLNKDYMLPLSIDKTPLQYHLTKYYFYFMSAYYYVLQFCQNYGIQATLPDLLPDIKINLEYYDINNKKFVKNFILNFKRSGSYGYAVPSSSSGNLLIKKIEQ